GRALAALSLVVGLTVFPSEPARAEEAAASAPASARERDADIAPAPPPRDEHFFYRGRDYGNESLYGPLWVFLNRAYDILQLRPGQRNVLSQPYGRDGKVVLRNLANPFPAISA